MNPGYINAAEVFAAGMTNRGREWRRREDLRLRLHRIRREREDEERREYNSPDERRKRRNARKRRLR